MSINFSNALGIHEQALILRSQRTALLANNIANASTPGYKARDMDFAALLEQASGQNRAVAMRKTNQRHISTLPEAANAQAMYRVASQASVDGNTVDEQLENAAFARNALEHQASFQFLNSKFTGLMKALKGE